MTTKLRASREGGAALWYTSLVPVEVELRAVGEADLPFLWRMLTFAASMEGSSAEVERARVDPDLRHYVEGFGRRGDVGVVALVNQVAAGAAWVRLAPPGPVSPSKVWSNEVPELAIATVPELRGAGVGTRLLRALLEAAGGLHSSVVRYRKLVPNSTDVVKPTKLTDWASA